METSDKLIQVRGLKKYYNGDAIKALDGVSVDINKGDVMVVIGPSGSGKSTFLRSIGQHQLMGQCGLFVFAEAAEIPLRNGIFTHFINSALSV